MACNNSFHFEHVGNLAKVNGLRLQFKVNYPLKMVASLCPVYYFCGTVAVELNRQILNKLTTGHRITIISLMNRFILMYLQILSI